MGRTRVAEARVRPVFIAAAGWALMLAVAAFLVATAPAAFHR
jgi:hypothetical protein